MTKEETAKNKKTVKRHGLSVLFVHCTVAISTFVLILTGLFGQFPMAGRYMLNRLPGLSWLSDFSVTLSLHYWAAAVLILVITYHIVFHGIRRDFDMLPRKGDIKGSVKLIMATFGYGKEPENDKYLPEQRLAYVFIGFSLLLLIFTGIFKTLDNLPDVDFPRVFMLLTSLLHNIGTVLVIIGIVVHLSAFIFKENWPLLPGIFTGKISLEYAKRRHSIWYNRVFGEKS
jgi:formate dehydrogenase gamma subunit